MAPFVSQALAVTGAGVVASLTPCSYPVLPLTLGFLGGQAGVSGQGSRVLWYVAGQSLTFVALGVVAVKIGETFGFSSESLTVNILVGALLIMAGLVSLSDGFSRLFARWNRISHRGSKEGVLGVLSSFALGVSAALIASPCTSPILAGVLASMASAASLGRGMLLMGLYGIGFSALFLALGLGVLRTRQLPKAGAWMLWVHRLSGAALMGTGIYRIATPFLSR